MVALTLRMIATWISNEHLWLLSHVWLFAIPWTIACQVPLSLGCSRQEYWSGLQFSTPGDLPDPVIQLVSCITCISRRVLYHWCYLGISILGGSKITADGDCSYEIKRCLFLGRKVMTNLDSILKSRGITLQTKVHLVKAVVFPVVMYGCESWTMKKVERWRMDAFELWCWE